MARDEVFELLAEVALKVADTTAVGCSAMGITVSEARVLACLAQHGPDRSGAIAEHVGISPRRMTQVMQGLDDKGHTLRADDPGDARVKVVSLTDSGQSLAQELRRLRGNWAAHTLDELDSHDLSVLESSLALIRERLTGPRAPRLGTR